MYKFLKCSVTQMVGVPEEQAEEVIMALIKAGYEPKKISVIKTFGKTVTITARG